MEGQGSRWTAPQQSILLAVKDKIDQYYPTLDRPRFNPHVEHQKNEKKKDKIKRQLVDLGWTKDEVEGMDIDPTRRRVPRHSTLNTDPLNDHDTTPAHRRQRTQQEALVENLYYLNIVNSKFNLRSTFFENVTRSRQKLWPNLTGMGLQLPNKDEYYIILEDKHIKNKKKRLEEMFTTKFYFDHPHLLGREEKDKKTVKPRPPKAKRKATADMKKKQLQLEMQRLEAKNTSVIYSNASENLSLHTSNMFESNLLKQTLPRDVASNIRGSSRELQEFTPNSFKMTGIFPKTINQHSLENSTDKMAPNVSNFSNPLSDMVRQP